MFLEQHSSLTKIEMVTFRHYFPNSRSEERKELRRKVFREIIMIRRAQ